MTRKKYKKLLMSRGVERNFAEFVSRFEANYDRQVNGASEEEYQASRQRYVVLADNLVRWYGGSMKKYVNLINWAIREADKALKDGGTV